MMEWIRDELGKETVLHISRFFPTYKLVHNATPEFLLARFFDIASEYLDYVYLGNISSDKGRDTICPECGHLLINRNGYHTNISGLGENGNCSKCGCQISLFL
jgi:pyruvate formate lyase activating enzyme